MTFHVHLNALHLSNDAMERLLQHGMKRANFLGTRAFENQYAAKHHLSFRSLDRESALRAFQACGRDGGDDLVGFVELEEVTRSAEFSLDKRAEFSPPGFALELMPPTRHRETELHVSVTNQEENVLLIQGLQDAGFYRTSLQRGEAERVILTVQGATEPIGDVFDVLSEYLVERGNGAGAIKLKEEKLLRFSSSPDFNWFAPQCTSVRRVSR